jgi:tripartite-type tricarboxylate transporter receptor subunit TctC
MFDRRHVAASLAAALALVAGSVWSQAFPAKPVRMIVPFAAGGPADTLTRTLAGPFGAALGQQVLVENRPGAGGNLAASFVAGAPADGYTLLVAGQAILAINKALYAKLAYDPERDFEWVGMMGSAANVLVAHPEAVPATTIAQFIELARAQPGKFSYGSNGIGSLSHLTTEVMASAANVKFVHVPYQGAAPQRADLLGGRIGFSFIAASATVPLVREGKLRALAVSTATRIAALPDVPTLVEAGFPMLDAPTWFAAVAHSATPPAALATLRSAFAQALASPALAGELDRQSTLLVRMTPQDAQAMLARERKVWTEAVRATGATAE